MNDTRIPLIEELSELDIRGAWCEVAFECGDGSAFVGRYRYAKYGDRFVRILESVREEMPPSTPQVSRYDESVRLPMMENGHYSTRLEAEQRRREWAEINKA